MFLSFCLMARAQSLLQAKVFFIIKLILIVATLPMIDFCHNYDKLGNSCTVDLPTRMQPVLKQGPTRYLRRNCE